MNREDIDNRLSLVQRHIEEIHEIISVIDWELDGINEDCSNNFIHPLKFVPSIIYELIDDNERGYCFDEYYFTEFNPEYRVGEYIITSTSNPYFYESLNKKTFNKFQVNPSIESLFGKWYHYDKSKLFQCWFNIGCTQSLRDFEQNDKMIVDSCLTTVGKEGEDVRKLSREFGYKMKFCKFWYNRFDNDYESTFSKLKLFKENGVSK